MKELPAAFPVRLRDGLCCWWCAGKLAGVRGQKRDNPHMMCTLAGPIHEITCDSSLAGRYLSIQILDDNSILTLCEVEVFAICE
eukprot:350499-Chlamydomonas_euryale.AAC.9